MAVASVLLTLTAAAPAHACGCGAVVSAPGAVVDVTSESAILSLKDGVETIVLSLGVDSVIANGGLIVPTPTPATIAPGDPALFDALHAQTLPRERVVDDWWGNLVAPGAPETAPQVISRVAVGPLEATTLEATDTAGLSRWLTDNGFELTGEVSSQLQQYIDKRWQFVAVRLSASEGADGTLLDGMLDPIQISFPSQSLQYPLGMAKAETSEQSLRLNVFSDTRVDLVRAGTTDVPLDAGVRTAWAGEVTEPALSGLGAFLTVVDVRLDTPATQISSEIGIVAAADSATVDPAVVVVRPIELLGFPLGTLLAVWAGLGLLGLLGVTIARSRLR
ncbi:hypothetical protein GCM10027413_22690 [Conyzicola nivalis]|uniref:DUF2330 domain-containing protein n=1 Tax=Conyzicola nivalis TaxID=1477021 RepID=A0A916SDL3_9MICO|nr:hypothetical protein GCM10010979_03930 [Conyzicola nivalis]